MKTIIENNKQLLENLTVVMHRMGIESFRELSKLTGVPYQTLKNIEYRVNGGVNVSTVRKLSEALNIKPGSLIFTQDKSSIDDDEAQFLKRIGDLRERGRISEQRFRTFVGQVMNGDLEGAKRGLERVMR